MDSESLLQFAVKCCFLHTFIDTLVVYSANFFLLLLKFPSRLVCFITYLAEPLLLGKFVMILRRRPENANEKFSSNKYK